MPVEKSSVAPAPVLVIDDDEHIRQLLVAVLEDAGYPAIAVDNGRDALETLAQITPALILLDVMMPRMDGFTFVTELARRGLRDVAPIIILTAAYRARPMVEQLAADGYIEKPFTIPTLLAEIERCLGTAP